MDNVEKYRQSLLAGLPLADLEELFQESANKDHSQAEKTLEEIAQRAIAPGSPEAMNFLMQSIMNYHLSFFSHSENGRSQLKISFPSPKI